VIVCSKCGLAVQPGTFGPGVLCVRHGLVRGRTITNPATTFEPPRMVEVGPQATRMRTMAILAMAMGALVGPPTGTRLDWKPKA